MAGSHKDLTPDQKAILAEFRKRVADAMDAVELNNDDILLHYLLVKKFKIDKAEKKLRKSAAWRKEQNEMLKDYVAPESLKKYVPYGQTGVDKEGDPVFLVRTGCIDHKGIWKSAGKENIYKFAFQEAERLWAELKADYVKSGRKNIGASMIIDMENFPISAAKKPKYINFGFEMYGLVQEHLPTSTLPIIKKIYVINNKPLYKTAIDLARSMSPEESFERVYIFGEKCAEWKAALLKDIPADQLPPHWGGTKAGKDEFCSDVICPGGTVPKEMYLPKKK